MRQLTVISGKGGTGKTSIVGAFASLASDKVIADCDVDAADLHLILSPSVIEEQEFRAMQTAFIDKEKCKGCWACSQACKFGAICGFTVDPLSCEGCGVCELVCPYGAITMTDRLGGKAYISQTRYGPLCHARLFPGEEASGKLVAKVRENARMVAAERDLPLIIIDGSPGIGCPVIASIGGVDLVLVVTEPTLSGIHDLERILAVADHFDVKAMVCINKCDINPSKSTAIREYCRKNSIQIAGEIPYDLSFTRAQVKGKTIIEHSSGPVADIIRDVWDEIRRSLRL